MFKPLKVGERCPLNETEWLKRKALFNCTDLTEEYHCLPNNLDVPGDVCMGSRWVQPNYCPVYNLNAKGFDAVPCDTQRGKCSSDQFQSREVFKYPGCLNFTRQPEVPQNGGMSMNFLPLIAGVGVGVVTLAVLGICCVWYCRRKGGSGGKNADVELRQPLVETFPSELHRTCHYLKANVFYPTKVFTKCIGLFEVNGSLIFVGPHGSGKTINAVNLLSKRVGTHISGKRCVVAVCKSVDDVLGKVDDTTVTFVLLDDVLDQYAYQPDLLKQDKPKYAELKARIDDGMLRLICTVTDTSWKIFEKAFSDCPLFQKDLVVELNQKGLDRHEKVEILRKHLDLNKFNITKNMKEENLKTVDIRQAASSSVSIGEKTLQNWAKKASVKGGMGIPLLFDLVCINKHLFASVDLILKDSLESIIKMRISHLWKDSKGAKDKDYACLLIFAAFKGGKVASSDFKNEENKYVKICSKIGCSIKKKDEIENMLKSDMMLGFFYPLSHSYIFHHNILTRLVLLAVANEHENLILEHAELNVLHKLLQPQKSKIPLSLVVNEKELSSSLIPRILKENAVAEWTNHVVMQTEKLKIQLEKVPANGGGKECIF